MSETIPLFLLHVLGFAGFLWLGLYALARGDRGDVATLFGLSALSTCCFFLTGGLIMPLHAVPGTFWANPATGQWINRYMWWDNVVPFALWLHLSLALTRGTRLGPWWWQQPVLVATYTAAALLTLLGLVDGIVRTFNHSNVAAGPAFVLYVAYVFAATGFAVVNLTRLPVQDRSATRLREGAHPEPTLERHAAVGSPEGAAHRLALDVGGILVVGAVLFLLGTGYLALKVLLNLSPYESPGYLLLLAGLTAVAAAVAVRSGLLLGKDLRRDVIYSATGLGVLLVPFLIVTGLLVGFDDAEHALFTLVLVALITTAHTLGDAGRALLDRAFFPPVVREERAAARAYAGALAAPPVGPHPDLATAKAIDDAVRRTLTHLSDPTKLAASPLLNLMLVARAVAESGAEDNRLNRAAALREVLLDLLDQLKPSHATGEPTSEALRYYNCLYYPYVRGIGRRRAPTVLRQLSERRRREGGPKSDLERVLEWLLDVDENTFYKWQRRGSDTIAAALREREAASVDARWAIAAPEATATPRLTGAEA